MVKDLIAEHATLTQEANSLRAQIKEGLFAAASVQEMRELQRELFHAKDRLKSIERSKQWERRK